MHYYNAAAPTFKYDMLFCCAGKILYPPICASYICLLSANWLLKLLSVSWVEIKYLIGVLNLLSVYQIEVNKSRKCFLFTVIYTYKCTSIAVFCAFIEIKSCVLLRVRIDGNGTTNSKFLLLCSWRCYGCWLLVVVHHHLGDWNYCRHSRIKHLWAS